jgi:hypothetical protein
LENNDLRKSLDSIEDMDTQKLARNDHLRQADELNPKLVDYMLPHSQQVPSERSTPWLESEERNGMTVILPSGSAK